jgi:excisionase family DNA binding protein
MEKIIKSLTEELELSLKKVLTEHFNNIQPIPSPQQTKYLTRKEVAERFNISLVTLNTWSKAGIIKSYTIGGRVLYKESEIEESLKEVKTVKF